MQVFTVYEVGKYRMTKLGSVEYITGRLTEKDELPMENDIVVIFYLHINNQVKISSPDEKWCYSSYTVYNNHV